jgi:hypothetical protein
LFYFYIRARAVQFLDTIDAIVDRPWLARRPVAGVLREVWKALYQPRDKNVLIALCLSTYDCLIRNRIRHQYRRCWRQANNGASWHADSDHEPLRRQQLRH